MLKNAVLTLLGLTMVLTPLGLWAAWNEFVYCLLLAVWIGAFALIYPIDTFVGSSTKRSG